MNLFEQHRQGNLGWKTHQITEQETAQIPGEQLGSVNG